MTSMDIQQQGAVSKHYFNGTQRTESPTRTLERIAAFLPAMGITRVANVTGLDKIGIPVVMTCRPNSRSLSVFQGKGVDLNAARASGVMEAVETYHAETILNPLKFASYAELRHRSHAVLDGNALPQSAQGCFHPHRAMLWIEGYDLIQKASVWVPYEVVHTDYSTSAPAGSGCFRISTNGLASGNHLLEAISYGLCEVIERDATTLWNFLDDRARQATEIDLATVDDELCLDLIGRCRQAGLCVRAWEATSDIGLPTFVAEIRENTVQWGAVWGKAAFGSGCHLTRQVAMVRALTEAVQVRTTFIAGARDDMSWSDYEHGEEQTLALRTGHSDEPGFRAYPETATWSSESFREDLVWAMDRLLSVGLSRLIAVDLTQMQFELPVVRVIVPELEGPDENFSDYVPGSRARAMMRALAGAVTR